MMCGDYLIMDITNGGLVGGRFETREEAEEWIENKSEEYRYEVIETAEGE